MGGENPIGDADTAMQAGEPETEGESTVGAQAQAQAQALAWQEHVADVLRLRRALTMGVLIWPAFAIVDLVAAMLIDPGALGWLLGIRFVVWLLVIIPATWRLYQLPTPSPGLLRALDVGVFGATAAAIALMCVPFGGLESIYGAGIVLAVIVRGAFAAESWRRAVLPLSIMAGSYVGVLLAAALFHDPVREMLYRPESLGHFAVYFFFIAGASVVSTVASHSIWQLRRQALGARMIGRYRLDKLLGSGGMGEVWRGRANPKSAPVAIKLLHPMGARAAEMVLRFEREVAATGRLRHPNTVRVYDYGVTEDGVWYYVMELIDGEPLDTLTARQGPLDPADALEIVQQVSGALAEAHAAGIVHRDIKPANVLLVRGADRRVAKLVDFGIARLAEEGDSALTQTNAIIGSPAYMAPEAAAGASTDTRTDVYGVGALLYLLVTGAPPTSGRDVAELVGAAAEAEPVPPSQKRGDPLPEAVEALIRRCMAKDPEERYGDAAELHAAVVRCRDEVTQGAGVGRDPGA